MRRALLALETFALGLPLTLHTMSAQEQIEVSGGASSLYQSQGGTATLRGKDFEGSLGGGLVDGRFVAGARVLYRHGKDVYTAGIEELQLGLPTDVFQHEHRLQGAGIDLRTTRGQMTTEVFAGATSKRLDTPLFQGLRAEVPTTAVLLEKTMSPAVTLKTDLLVSRTKTFLQGIGWKPTTTLELAASAGMSGSARYAAVSGHYARPLLDLKASYVTAGRDFVRVGSDPEVDPEPEGLNVMATWRSSNRPRFTLAAGHQNSLIGTAAALTDAPHFRPSPSAASNIASVDQASATASLGHTGFTGSMLHSSYNGQGDLAYTLSAMRRLSSRVDCLGSYFESHATLTTGDEPVNRSLVGTVHERLSNHLAVNENFNRSNGGDSINFGGTVQLSNLTLSAGYQTFYIPTQPAKPFQQSLIVDVQVSLLGRMTLHAGTFVAPDGKLLYTMDVRAVRTLNGGSTIPVEHARLGAALLRGRVVDEQGRGVPGAVIQLGDTVLYTDSTGAFFLRERRPTVHHYSVLFDQFLDGQSYRIVSAPGAIESSKSVSTPSVIVVSSSGTVAAVQSRQLEP